MSHEYPTCNCPVCDGAKLAHMVKTKMVNCPPELLPWQIHSTTEYRLLAGFTYYQEVLDYVAYANSRGANLILATWSFRAGKWKFERRNADGTTYIFPCAHIAHTELSDET